MYENNSAAEIIFHFPVLITFSISGDQIIEEYSIVYERYIF